MAKAKSERGRPRSALPQEILDRLGPAPIGQPLKLARWFTNAIALLTEGVIAGKPWGTMLETVRASAGAAGRVLPHDVIFEAQRRLDADARELKDASAGGRVVARKDADVAQRTGPVRRDSARG